MGWGLAIGAGLSLLSGAKARKGYRRSARGMEETARRYREQGAEQKVYNDVAATQARAVGQHQALEEMRQARLMASRAVAVAAAGGHSADITNLIADIDGEGIYRAGLALHAAETEAARLEFEGEQALKYADLKADQQYDQARAMRKQGDASLISSLGSVFTSGLFDGPWGGGGMPSSSASKLNTWRSR